MDAFLLLLSILLINSFLKRRHPERYADLLLVEKEQPGIHTLDLAIVARNEDISYISNQAIEFCRARGIEEERAVKCRLSSWR